MKIAAYGFLLAVESALSLSGRILEGASNSFDATALALFLVTIVPTGRSFAHALFDGMFDDTIDD